MRMMLMMVSGPMVVRRMCLPNFTSLPLLFSLNGGVETSF